MGNFDLAFQGRPLGICLREVHDGDSPERLLMRSLTEAEHLEWDRKIGPMNERQKREYEAVAQELRMQGALVDPPRKSRGSRG